MKEGLNIYSRLLYTIYVVTIWNKRISDNLPRLLVVAENSRMQINEHKSIFVSQICGKGEEVDATENTKIHPARSLDMGIQRSDKRDFSPRQVKRCGSWGEREVRRPSGLSTSLHPRVLVLHGLVVQSIGLTLGLGLRSRRPCTGIDARAGGGAAAAAPPRCLGVGFVELGGELGDGCGRRDVVS